MSLFFSCLNCISIEKWTILTRSFPRYLTGYWVDTQSIFRCAFCPFSSVHTVLYKTYLRVYNTCFRILWNCLMISKFIIACILTRPLSFWENMSPCGWLEYKVGWVWPKTLRQKVYNWHSQQERTEHMKNHINPWGLCKSLLLPEEMCECVSHCSLPVCVLTCVLYVSVCVGVCVSLPVEKRGCKFISECFCYGHCYNGSFW